ncbi:G2/mitotic-specific cyclin-B3 [Topomyia yanbarensis]|uniref:G2/mitotic-specific cyclin-B3 n=1 Tax=Topomyia yanbarensis TaxID=2498891 RepID=UPI00273C979A|nr:G2/mitotic-specific cyclin-B3 [Topomyia yanbarensis]XP_058815894.1 G2/mitotic-specific cyclin-B3 [Topomyia yanbarensis]XP_058815902.1 G2/mitotic-specific cyclin-B3 [Topomyia yanbarensis]XP_058815910.1 G2/mitotic-specific cyclin-B3 [Topomyia yanbarensis]
MAPVKQNGTTALLPQLMRKTITTRSKQSNNNQNQNTDDQQPAQRGKRKADLSPLKNDRGVKRSALGNLTNAVVHNAEADADIKGGKGANAITVTTTGAITIGKQASQLIHQLTTNIANSKKTATCKTATTVKTEVFTKPDPDGPKTRAATKILTRAASRQQLSGKNTVARCAKNETSASDTLKSELSDVANTIVKSKEENSFQGEKLPSMVDRLVTQLTKPKRRISNEFEKTDDSLYVSALEDVTSSGSLRLSDNFTKASSQKNTPSDATKVEEDTSSPRKRTPDGVEDYDFANWNDVFQISHYAQDIFLYQKEREPQFAIPDYISKQPHISKWMRALLVDWMVEIQESFELNHETLYLAVKIVDIYLSRAEVQKDSLQLLGAAALFIASKYDERVPPTVDDFHYICDGAYERREMILMEMTVFKTIGYDLGIPLSYRFLRRYARVNRIEMKVLTLARYILEFSLMDYAIVQLRDSKLACAALFIAMRMSNMPGWNKTLEYYSGYKIEDFAEIAILLNNIMTRKPKESLNTVRHKYSHELFFESAKKPFITDLTKLFDTTDYQPLRSPAPTTPIVSISSVPTTTRSQQSQAASKKITTTTTTV